MPIYEYACEKCGKLTEVMAKVDDPPPGVCPNCGAKKKMQKVLSKSTFQLKGGGWYSDLYGNKPGGSGSGGDSGGGKKD